MRKSIYSIGRLSVLGAALFITSCGKDDTAPVITLTGDNPAQLEMRTIYVDPGFAATDDKDGNVTASVVVDASGVNENLPGSYTVNYSVADKEGNTGVQSRGVTVFATNDAMADSYSVVDTCGSVVFTYGQSIVSVSTSTIVFSKFGDYLNNNTVYANISEDGTITLPSQMVTNIGSLSEDHTFSGTGHVTENGFDLTYTDINNTQGNASTTCKAHFTR